MNLETERLHLLPLTAADAADIFEYARDEEMAKNTSWPAHETIEDTRTFLTQVLSRQRPAGDMLRIVWGIRIFGTKKVIGTISFVQDEASAAHVDFALSRLHWGKGLISEAVACVVAAGFNAVPGLEQINSGCLSRNTGSVRVLEKNGFEILDKYESRRGGKFNNAVLETTLFVLNRSRWNELNSG